ALWSDAGGDWTAVASRPRGHTLTQESRPVHGTEHRTHGGEFDIGVHPGAPAGAAIGVSDLDVGNSRRLLAGAQGVLAIIHDLEAWHAGSAKPVDQRRQRAVAFPGNLDRPAVVEQARAAADHAVAALGLEALELPRRGPFDVLAPEHALQLRPAHLAAEAVHFLVGDWAELALHFLGQLDAVFIFQQVGDTALAGLAVDADDLAVAPANV